LVPTKDSVDSATEALGIAFTPEELAQEQNLFVPGVAPGPSELDAVCIGMRDRSLNGSIGCPIPWPAMGLPLSEYSTEGLFSMAFPTLFPIGDADFTLPCRKKLDLHEWVKHLMRYRDSRFATHPRFRFFALNLIFRHRAMQQGRFLFSRSIGNRTMTVGQLKAALARDDGPSLASKIVRCLRAVRGTRPYWYMEGAKLKDMINQIGTPTLFYTLSMADLSWPDLHRLMPDDPFRPGLTDAQSFQIRLRNVANNPHIVSAYLSTRHRHLRETILQHLDVAGDASVTDYWFRVEWQARGSGMCPHLSKTGSFLEFLHDYITGHIHGFLWLENAIPVDAMDWTNPGDLEKIKDYFSRIITASNPDPFRPRPPRDCLLEDLLPPEARNGWDFEEDHCNLCNRCQKHGTLVRGQSRCNPAQCHKRGSCRFHFPYPLSAQPLAHIDSEARKRFAPTRNDAWLNQHSKAVLLGWRANVDLQPVLDRMAAIRYISKYASKPETVSDSYCSALVDFCSRLPEDQPAENAVQRLFARMAADRDISAQEAVHLLLGEQLIGCSRAFVNINSHVDAAHVLREEIDLDDNDPAFEDSFFAKYQNRPVELEALNAVELCRRFDLKRRASVPFRIHLCLPLTVRLVFQDTEKLSITSVAKRLWSARGLGCLRFPRSTTLCSRSGHWRNCGCSSRFEHWTNFACRLLRISSCNTLRLEGSHTYVTNRSTSLQKGTWNLMTTSALSNHSLSNIAFDRTTTSK
jgi:hypothetical protein